MHTLHPFFLVVIVVAAFVSLGIPVSKKDNMRALTTGLVFAAFAIVMNAVFQWEHPSPVNLLLLNEHAGTFEVVLLSIACASILRSFVGLLCHGWRTPRLPKSEDSDTRNS